MKFHHILCLFLLAYLNLCLTLTIQNSPTQNIKNVQKVIDLRQLKVDISSGQKLTEDIYFVLTNSHALEAKSQKQLSPDDIVCAYAKLENTIDEIGWHQLHVEAEGKCGRLGTMYAAGWVEGYLSSDDISNYYNNYISKDSDLMTNLAEMKEVLDNVYRNTLEKTQKGKTSQDQKEETFWNGIELFTAQFEGLVAGFLTRNKNLDREDIMLINSNGELSDLLSALPTFLNQQIDEILTQQSSREIKKRINRTPNTDGFLTKKFSVEEAHQLRVQGLLKSHCSAFIKLLRDSHGLVEDVLMSHGTWDDFEGMLKIMKKYNLKVQTTDDEPATEYKIIFPSYPGSLTSQDDFYVRGDGMMLMETSLNVYDDSIYAQNLDPAKYLPTFLKLAASNYLGNTAKKWVDYFSFINTHTYNSQWMVLDVESISKSIGKTNLVNGTFYVLEQIPGVMLSKDMTNTLNKESYWSSFNMPIFDETYEKSGAKSVYDRTGSEEFSRTQDPRAVRFRNLQSTVKDVESLKDLIRLNTAEKDGSPQSSQIAPRCDLSKVVYESQLFGETDAKIANYKLAREISLIAVSGPTQVNSGPFSFSDDVYQTLKGVPQTWDFGWEQYGL